MSEKLTLARIKRFGQTFELSVDPDKAQQYRKGEITDLREVLLVEDIYTDARKGLRATDETLAKAFQTTEFSKIADAILRKGELQLSSDQRAEERERRRKQLVNMIHVQAVDSTNNLPHPAARIEAALVEANIRLEDHKTVEEQFDGIISKLRPIIPLKIEQKEVTITIPAEYTGKSYQTVKSNSKILKEDWLSNGNWQVRVAVPAGLYPDLIEKINSVTRGEARIEG